MSLPGPGTRVVEFRVHGVAGTTPESLLDAVAAVDVAGNGVGRIVRPADRLRRPAPGPVLKADGRPLPRTLEGYVWGGLAPGRWARVLWALLVPFSLANASSWMLPPVPADSRPATVLRVCCQALLRLAAVLLTMLLVTQLAAVSLDLVATQCLAPGAGCLRGVVPDWVRTTAAVRPVIGLVPLLVVVLVLGRVSRVRWTVDSVAPDGPARKLSRLPGARGAADPDTAALRGLHLIAALATIALVALGGPTRPAAGVAAISWWAAVVLLVAGLLVALVFGDPTGVRSGSPGRWLLSPVARRLLVGLAVLTVVSVPAVAPRLGVAGTDPTLVFVTVGLAGAGVLLGVLLVPAALLARAEWAALPVELRPWAGGWLAAPVMVLAALLGGGFGALIGITVRQLLGGALPHGYAFLTLIWGVAGALALVGLAGVLGARRLFGVRVADEVRLLHGDRPADAATTTPVWRAAGWLRGHAHQVLLTLAGVLAVGAGVSAVPWWEGALPPAWTQGVSAFGLAVLVSVAGWLAPRLVMSWPRVAHPVIPPCHALKVAPEVAARAAEHLAEPNTRVVLTGHGEGAAIVVAAATRLLDGSTPGAAGRLGVVVAGAPLQWAYPRVFPSVVSHDGLLELFGDLDGRWRTMARGTDPLGGGVSTWRRQEFDGQLIGVGFRTDGTSGALPPAVTGPTGALVLGGDHWLPDPSPGPFAGRRWAAGVLRGADYYSDPEWDRAIACAAGLESPTEVRGEQHGVFRLPGRSAS